MQINPVALDSPCLLTSQVVLAGLLAPPWDLSTNTTFHRCLLAKSVPQLLGPLLQHLDLIPSFLALALSLSRVKSGGGDTYRIWSIYLLKVSSLKDILMFEIMVKFQLHGQNRAQRLRYVILWQISEFFYFIRKNATTWTSLAFQMSALERFEKVNFSKNMQFWPSLKMGHP